MTVTPEYYEKLKQAESLTKKQKAKLNKLLGGSSSTATLAARYEPNPRGNRASRRSQMTRRKQKQ